MLQHKVKVYVFLLTIGTLSLFIFHTQFTPFSFAQTLVCPTPDQRGLATLQLIPCYLVTPTPGPTSIPLSPGTSSIPVLNLTLPSPQPAPQAGTQTNSGAVCQSDSIEVSACTCPSYEEEDNICSDPNCIADGGDPWTPFMLDNRTGAPAGANCSFTLHDGSAIGAGASSGSGSGSGSNCVKECNSKPIIYLYPTKTTNVNVKLSLQGHVTVSNPIYPSGGWQNIEAHPNGSLIYQGKSYRELYYESETIKVKPVPQGIFIPSSQLQPKLEELTTKLGLDTFERGEFLDYWVPRLRNLHSPYILFSVFAPEEKAKVDSVMITPRPDTFIEFLAYFKPVASVYPIKPLQLPKVPQRKGFTAVEWGGTIDN
jgi:hypothetical protein